MNYLEISLSLSLSFFQVMKIFNLFITYGDTFLPSPTTYDELYYELIRMQKVFEDIYSMGEQLSMGKLVPQSLLEMDRAVFSNNYDCTD